ncbi:hypothetical protein RhiirA4_247227 [Rhizophagus irregularis]|uniref:Uncharacterized protein n=1 Tax=Rhizophagus irregularis TaxID=588596 RepID=A0A2I1GS93_9GLOM|nr:hypothetical protein RhiirA4_247227 [Rhizophagus irregularis]
MFFFHQAMLYVNTVRYRMVYSKRSGIVFVHDFQILIFMIWGNRFRARRYDVIRNCHQEEGFVVRINRVVLITFADV